MTASPNSMWRERKRFVDAKASLWAGLVLRVSQRVGVRRSAGPSGVQAVCVYSVCVHINLCFLILLFRQMYSAESITTLEAMIFL